MQRSLIALALLGSGSAFCVGPSRVVTPVRGSALRSEAEGAAVEAAAEEAAPAAAEVVAEAAAPAGEVGATPSTPASGEEGGAKRAPRGDKSAATPLKDLVEGQQYPGTITGVAAYGAFVDVGAQSDGLVHISELSSDYVEDVASVATVGDSVTVTVLKVDTDKRQLSLSMKDPNAPPPPKRAARGGRPKKAGAEELRKYLEADPSEFVDGVVASVLGWGAFVTIAPGVDGLVHISRVSDQRIDDLEAELSVGQAVKVRVEGVDLDKMTVALAMNTYRDPTAAPRPGGGGGGGGGGDGPGESARARRARNPDQDKRGGGQRRPKRRDPGDDIWESDDTFNWKDVVIEDLGDEDEVASGFVVDLESGKLTLQ